MMVTNGRSTQSLLPMRTRHTSAEVTAVHATAVEPLATAVEPEVSASTSAAGEHGPSSSLPIDSQTFIGH